MNPPRKLVDIPPEIRDTEADIYKELTALTLQAIMSHQTGNKFFARHGTIHRVDFIMPEFSPIAANKNEANGGQHNTSGQVEQLPIFTRVTAALSSVLFRQQ